MILELHPVQRVAVEVRLCLHGGKCGWGWEGEGDMANPTPRKLAVEYVEYDHSIDGCFGRVWGRLETFQDMLGFWA